MDIFVRDDGSFGFEEFRRDSEDMGKWTGLNYYSALKYESQDRALIEARKCVAWLDEVLL